MWPFSTSATRVSRPAALIKRMLPMGEPRARASGLAVRRTGGGGIERFGNARDEGVRSCPRRRRPRAAWAVLGRRMQGVHESQDSLEVLWCYFPAARSPGLGVAGVIALGLPEGCAARCGVPGTQVTSKIPFSPDTCREGGARARDSPNPADPGPG